MMNSFVLVSLDYYDKVHRFDVSNNRNESLTVLETENQDQGCCRLNSDLQVPILSFCPQMVETVNTLSLLIKIIFIKRVPSSWFYLKVPPKSPPLNTIHLDVKVPIYRYEEERGHEHVGCNIFRLQTKNAVCQTKKKIKNLLFVFDVYDKEVAYFKYQYFYAEKENISEVLYIVSRSRI